MNRAYHGAFFIRPRAPIEGMIFESRPPRQKVPRLTRRIFLFACEFLTAHIPHLKSVRVGNYGVGLGDGTL
jgi:hypothetical protein